MANQKARALVAAAQKAQSGSKRVFTEIKGSAVFKFSKIGQSIEGTLVKVKRPKVKGRDAVIYRVQHDDGTYTSFWANSYLDQRMEDVAIGTYVRVTYVDDEDVGEASPMRVFKAEVSQ